eukprot:27600-Rhodomonas_salina.3
MPAKSPHEQAGLVPTPAPVVESLLLLTAVTATDTITGLGHITDALNLKTRLPTGRRALSLGRQD